ncbi:MAG: hypothetical protein PVG63_04975 [Anaerolineales bacterium]|jgi:glycosyltransferase involved in cell wall biosynthesis
MKIIVNGWDLAAHPFDPHSLFAFEWLRGLAETRPEWEFHMVVPHSKEGIGDEIGINVQDLKVRPSALAQIRFEQRQLINLARSQQADVLLFPTGGGPINTSLPVVTFAPTQSVPSERSIGGRLVWAIRSSGQAGASTRVRLHEPDEINGDDAETFCLPAWVSERFNPLKQPSDRDVLSAHDLKPGYLLSFVQDQNSLGRILEVWRWLTDTVDPGGPMILTGLEDQCIGFAQALIAKLGLDDWVRMIGGFTLSELPAMYRQAACYFHGAPSRSGQELRWALATGVPVAGIETSQSAHVLGEAAYLAPPRDVRALVAACITVLVEPQMAEELRKRGLSRARGYHQESFFERLARILLDARRS